MSQRRMFSPKIVGSDAFLEMPTSSRELYFQLGMYADDDGFISPRKIMRMVGSSDDDLKMLIAKRFVLPFENGVVVIKHWRINNLIRKDFYQATEYLDQRQLLFLKDNGAYTDDSNKGISMLINPRQQIVNNPLPQVRVVKVNSGKGEGTEKAAVAATPTPKEEMKYFIQDQEPTIKWALSVKPQVEPATIREECKKFLSFWMERNPTGTKHRWEMQKTFEVRRRFITWLNKDFGDKKESWTPPKYKNFSKEDYGD